MEKLYSSTNKKLSYGFQLSGEKTTQQAMLKQMVGYKENI